MYFIAWPPQERGTQERGKLLFSTNWERYEFMIDHCSYITTWAVVKLKLEKKFRPEPDSNPWPLQWRICCTGIAEVKGLNTIQAWILFQALISQLPKVFVTVMINRKFRFIWWLLLGKKRVQYIKEWSLHTYNVHVCQKNRLVLFLPY